MKKKESELLIDFNNRIKELPIFESFYNSTCNFNDSISENGIINYDNLSDENKLCLFIYAWNKTDILPSKSNILKTFNWTNYKLQKLIKNLNGLIKVYPTFNENTGLLSGRGYFFDKYKMNEK